MPQHKLQLLQAARILNERGWDDINSAILRNWGIDGLLHLEKKAYQTNNNAHNPKYGYYRVLTWAQVDHAEKICLMRALGYSKAQISGYFAMPESEERTKVTANIINRAEQKIRALKRAEDVLLNSGARDRVK